ncbi:uncharacterized protein ASPGLDRAFT_709940 [Aspergillus glaucus CBS 516.65]|uniref:Uncharacterized protein n=1 Tax=Aspergillus glaucus CBS 516.65 TaxID=1160497 RepID=A0A1L9VX31_ASPGL|nr:hypothetical protein ASPGLDRAFT_709940 [Aspergillus glaucus CBS 516.65]OJJ88471.1 hypothetical protein ASPGLDRAFT_709940 [Aspergillus glaucus CBS 516.65]
MYGAHKNDINPPKLSSVPDMASTYIFGPRNGSIGIVRTASHLRGYELGCLVISALT